MKMTPEKLDRLLESKQERRLRVLKELRADIWSEHALYGDACAEHYTPARDFYADLAMQKIRLIDKLIDLEETEYDPCLDT